MPSLPGLGFNSIGFPAFETLGYDMAPLRGWRIPSLLERRALHRPLVSPKEGQTWGTRQKLLSGIKEHSQFEKLRTALEAFRDEAIDTPDYEAAARFYNLCRSHGMECGPVDILICAVAMRRKWSVLANDARLNQCLQIIVAHRP